MASVTVSFTLDDKTDRDILHWLRSQPKKQRSQKIREALRACIGHRGVTLDDLYQAIQDLRPQAITAADQDRLQSNEPPDVAAALDKLGL